CRSSRRRVLCKLNGADPGIAPRTRETERMATTAAVDFDIATLRARRTNKWHKFPPEVLPAWVADMDFGVAPSITAALTRLTQNQEYGYAAREGALAAALFPPIPSRSVFWCRPAPPRSWCSASRLTRFCCSSRPIRRSCAPARTP